MTAKQGNPRCTEVLPLDREPLEKTVALVDSEADERHREATDTVIDAFEGDTDNGIRSAIRRAAIRRQFLG